MTFLAPLWFLLLGLAPLVVYLHARRRRTVEVGSVLHWALLEAGAERPARGVPRPNALMILQLAALLLIAMALAQPVMGDPAEVDHAILVLDGSGSMQATDAAPTRWDAARSALLATLGEGGTRRVSVVVARAGGRIQGGRMTDATSARRVLEAAVPGHGPDDWSGVAAKLPGLVLPDERTAVVVATDPAGRAPAATAVAHAVPDAELSVWTFGGSAENAGFGGLTFDRTEDAWRVRGTIVHTRESWEGDVRVLLQRTPDARPRELAVVPVEGESGHATGFDFELEPEAAGLVTLELPTDALAHDDRGYLSLAAAVPPVRVAHVGPEDADLWRALEAVPHVEVFHGDRMPADAHAYDLIVVTAAGVIERPATNVLWMGVPPDGSGESVHVEDASPNGWDRTHPLSLGIAWQDLIVHRARAVPRLPAATILLESPDGPLLQARATPEGMDVVVSFALDDASWQNQASFPAFLANLVHWIRPDAARDPQEACHVAVPCPIAGLDPGVTVEWRATPADDWLEVDREIARAEPTRGAARIATASLRANRAGQYKLAAGDGTIVIPVDAPYPEESALSSREATTEGEPTPTRSLRAWILALAAAVILGEGILHHVRARAAGARVRRAYAYGLTGAALLLLALAAFDFEGPVFAPHEYVVHVSDGTGERPEGAAWVRSSQIRLAQQSRIVSDFGSESDARDDAPELPGADLEGALELANALLAGKPSGRIHVHADGHQTRGDARSLLPFLQASGHPVDVVRRASVETPDVVVEEVSVAEPLHPDVPFRLQAVVRSDRSVVADVSILRDGAEWWTQRDVRLAPGYSRIESTLREEEEGSYLYEVEVRAVDDSLGANDHAGTIAAVGAGPTVAIVSPQVGWGLILQEALAVQGMRAEVLAPTDVPRSLSGWLAYDTLIMMDVPAIDLNADQQEQLERWVREHGGGLVIMGGENAFGPGGYYQTPLERLSPLSSRVEREQAEVAVLFVLDRSGSMQQKVGDVDRLQIAKDATLEAIRLLDASSRAGIVVFDSQTHLLVPLRPADDAGAFADALRPVASGGGTALQPALVRGFEQLSRSEASLRHMVVMTDGLSSAGDFDGIMEQIAAEGISVSTVGIGESAGGAHRRLELIAEGGEGTFHATDDFRALPSIMAQEVLLLATDPVEEGRVVPLVRDRDVEFLRGISSDLPAVDAFVRTTPKPEARVHLVAPDEAPLLASWRYGLGRVAAFASHGAGAWSLDWLEAPVYPRLWAQAARWVAASAGTRGIDVRARHVGDELVVDVEMSGPAGEPHVGRAAQAHVRRPDGSEGELALLPVAAGVYSGTFPLTQTGNHHVRVEGEETSAATDVHVAYPAWYGLRGNGGGDTLAMLARGTGGTVIETMRDAGWAPNVSFVRRPLWRWCALVGGALFLMALFVRPSRGSGGAPVGSGASGVRFASGRSTQDHAA